MLSYCRICAAACGITVTVDGDRVLRVRGDAGHPVSRGYTCSKGRGLAAWHHRDGRLDRPRLRGREVAWDDVLDDLAAVLRDTIDGSRCRRDRAVPRHRDGLRRRRPDRGRDVPRRARQQLLLHRGHRRQRAGARRRRAGDRQRDDEPAVGSDHPGPAPARRHQPDRLARLRHDHARSGQLPPRPPARRWSHVGDRSAAHRERRPRRRAPRHASGHRRARPRRAGAASCSTRRRRRRAAATTARPTTSTRCGARSSRSPSPGRRPPPTSTRRRCTPLVDDLRAHRTGSRSRAAPAR